MTSHAHDAYVCGFAAGVLQNKLRALCKERDGVKGGEDVEHVHRMRVASRRLRTALDLFQDCLPPKRFAVWRKRTKGLTRALGAARDCDVQIAFVKEFLGSLHEPSHRPGIERLLLRLERCRGSMQKKVIRAVDRFEESGVAEDLRDAAENLEHDASNDASLAHGSSLYHLAAERIASRLAEMSKYESFISRPECTAEHHAMRIASKRLRYTLEMFAPLYDDELRSPLQTARDVQEQLGQIHDCDVWVTFVPKFLEAERARALKCLGHLDGFAELVGGMDALREDRARVRSALHTQFVAFWENLRKHQEWSALRMALEARSKLTGNRI